MLTLHSTLAIFVTTTPYPHLMLECIHSGKHPSIIGPVLIHQKVDFSSFGYFASTLVSHDRYLSVLMALVLMATVVS